MDSNGPACFGARISWKAVGKVGETRKVILVCFAFYFVFVIRSIIGGACRAALGQAGSVFKGWMLLPPRSGVCFNTFCTVGYKLIFSLILG